MWGDAIPSMQGSRAILRPRSLTSTITSSIPLIVQRIHRFIRLVLFYPSIDIQESKSRVRDHVISADQRASANAVSRLEAAYREKEDLILVGAYHEGSDRTVDAALRLRPQVLEFLQQLPEESSAFDVSKRALVSLASQIEQATRRS